MPATTIRYLAALNAAGFEVHAALSGAEVIDPTDASLLDAIGVRTRVRPNAGLDFGAWQDLIEDGVAHGADEVLLANDSVFGPLAPLAPIVRSMAGFDAWGMVESREGRPHLQSWFVWMSRQAFERPAVRRVFVQPFATMTKAEIIVHGELGLGAAFEAEGLDVGARYRDLFRVRPSRLVATNPMHYRWRFLLESGAVPFLKVELVRDNPSQILGVDAWQQVLRRLGIDDVDAISASLRPRPATRRLGLRQVLLQLALREDRLAVLRDLGAARLKRDGRA